MNSLSNPCWSPGRKSPLPQGPAAKPNSAGNKNKIYPIAQGNGFPTTGAGSRHNSENTELYPVHPFRLYGVGKTTLRIPAVDPLSSPCSLSLRILL